MVEEVKEKQDQKKKIINQIEEYKNKEIQIDTKIKKFEDDLIDFKKDKHFLDILAIQAGNKPYAPVDKTKVEDQSHIQ